jgi:hypothetical protein
MTYVIADTQYIGKKWAGRYLPSEEKHRVLSTGNQIRGKAFNHHDCLYIITSDNELTQVLLPALCGCTVHSHNEWISQNWRKKYAKANRA